LLKQKVVEVGCHPLLNITAARCEDGKIYAWGHTLPENKVPTEVHFDSIDDFFLFTCNLTWRPYIKVHEKKQDNELLKCLSDSFNQKETSDLKVNIY
jgi:hypothetical protein